MDAAVLLTFAAASLVLAAAPGPDILYVLAQSAQSGARAGLAVVIGLMIGCLIQTAAAAAGLAAVVAPAHGFSGPFVLRALRTLCILPGAPGTLPCPSVKRRQNASVSLYCCVAASS